MPKRLENLAEQIRLDGESLVGNTISSAQKIDDATLVAGAQRKERWALETLIRRYQAKAFAIAYRMSAGDEEQARDLTQEAFIKVLSGINQFKGKSNFYTWFYRIVVNTCLDAHRKGKRWRQIFKVGGTPALSGSATAKELEAHGDHHPSADPMANLTGKQLKLEIKAALAQLSDHQRMVFTLKVFEGFSIADIAIVMNTAKGTVKSHLFRATRHMRKVLGHWKIS